MSNDGVIGLVLAGGRARRFDGKDKGWLEYRGTPLVHHALIALGDCQQLVISANRNIEAYAELQVPVVSDQREGFEGPLSGIESVMLSYPADWYYVLPCDVLGTPAHWRDTLLARARVVGSPWVGTRAGERVQPLLGVWSRELLPQISAFLDAGGRRVMEFLQPWSQHVCDLPTPYSLHNINTPEALAEARTLKTE